jgi:uncharacterized SAM-binding protein YcdF (DUF218 family)
MLKLLVDPIGWYLVLQGVGLVVIHRSAVGRPRQVVPGLALLTILLGIAAMPLTGTGLERSLRLTRVSSGVTPPEFIFVLGGGYVAGARPEDDVLVVESLRRVLYAVEVWRSHPTSLLVFSGGGTEGTGERGEDRLAGLMAQVARRNGVPASAVLLEARSRNTRQHPMEGLKLPGVTRATPVGIVTSAWHLRRARREFSRHFQYVESYPIPQARRVAGWRDIVPSSSGLQDNTILIREWFGILWYSVLARLG